MNIVYLQYKQYENYINISLRLMFGKCFDTRLKNTNATPAAGKVKLGEVLNVITAFCCHQLLITRNFLLLQDTAVFCY